MKNKLFISCPQCTGSNSDFFKQNNCSYCNSTKKVDILEHMKVLDIKDERLENVTSFISDSRFSEYLSQSNGKKQYNNRPR